MLVGEGEGEGEGEKDGYWLSVEMIFLLGNLHAVESKLFVRSRISKINFST